MSDMLSVNDTIKLLQESGLTTGDQLLAWVKMMEKENPGKLQEAIVDKCIMINTGMEGQDPVYQFAYGLLRIAGVIEK